MLLTTKKLQYKDVIQQINEESIAKFYLGVGIHQPFNSYFREDPLPSARLYYYHNRIYYNDFIKSMTLPDLIMFVNSWSYKELMKAILRDFFAEGIQTYKPKKIRSKIKDKSTKIEVKYRKFESWDLEYWGAGGITKEWLEFANIFPIKYYWVNNYLNVAHKWSYTYNCYWENSIYRRKIYQPLNEDLSKKWISNINKTVLTGWDTLPKQGGDLLTIASSYKDTGVIQCNLTEPNSRRMLPSCAPNNEGTLLPEVVVPKIKARFKRLIVWFDPDYAGRLAAEKYRQKYNAEPIFIPEKFKAKDPFEYRSIYGEEDFIKLSKYLIYGN